MRRRPKTTTDKKGRVFLYILPYLSGLAATRNKNAATRIKNKAGNLLPKGERK
jgi:hypothetical protein